MKYLLFALGLLASNLAFGSPKDSIGSNKILDKLVIIYKVEKGDGLLAIAKKYNTTVDEIKKMNPKLKTVSVGQKIYVPHKIVIDSTKILIDESHANADLKEIDKTKKHIVQRGENLQKIAAKYKISVQQILKWNNVLTNQLLIGQELIVSGNIGIAAYEKWNFQNSQSLKFNEPKNILSPTTKQVEERGFSATTPKITHPTLPIGSYLICTNTESRNQILLKVESNALLPNQEIIGISKEVELELNLTADNKIVLIKYLNQ